MSVENLTLAPGETPDLSTTCHAAQTFHIFCGHITTAFTNHSPLCECFHEEPRPGPSRSRRSRSSSAASSLLRYSAEEAPNRPETADSGISKSGALTRLTRAISIRASSIFRSDNLRSIAGAITGRRDIPDDPANTFSFSAIPACPQLIVQPLYDPTPCTSCAKTWGLEAGGAGEGWDREMTAEESEELEKTTARVMPAMKEWALKMNDWDNGIRIVRKGGLGKVMIEDTKGE